MIFLSEAFTRPAMMQTLAKIGFHQSYTYFTWRNTKDEITEYLEEVSGEQGAWMRPASGRPRTTSCRRTCRPPGVRGFAVRAILAATRRPTWGIYSGYELVEDVPRPGVEEQIDNEKYEFKPRDWSQAERDRHRRCCSAAQRDRAAPPRAAAAAQPAGATRRADDATVAFAKHLPRSTPRRAAADTVLVVVNLDPWNARGGTVERSACTALGPGPGRRSSRTTCCPTSTYDVGARPPTSASTP